MATSGDSGFKAYRHDPALSRKMIITIGLLVTFYVLVMGLLINAGVAWWLVLGLGVGAVVLQWRLASRMLVASTGAHSITEEQAPDLFALLHRLVAMYHLPMPQVVVQPSAVPNAFAAGTSPNDSLICVSTGLLDILNTEEIEAVLAHELAHIANRDVAVMTMSTTGNTVSSIIMRVSAVVAGASGLAATATERASRRKDDEGAGLLFGIMLASVVIMVLSAVVYAISSLLVRALSRYRELAADRAAAQLTGRPSALASALTKVSQSVAVIPREDLRAAGGVTSMSFIPAFADDHPLRWLLSTHPTLKDRLENLAKVAQELNEPHG